MPNRARPREAIPDATGFLPALVRTYAAALSTFEHKTGVHLARWRVLDVLRRQGEMPQRALTWHTLIDPAAVSRILHTFEETGDVTRQTDPADQRQSLVALTAQGLEKARHIADIREQFLADAQAGITPADISRLEATLGALRANLERMRVDKA